MLKLPQGKSNFRELVRGGFHYVDKTPFVRILEDFSNSYVFFLRPRRFGKSLFVSMMMHYYGEQHKDEFQALFGKYDIGRNPTPLANSYLVLLFEFSGLETSNRDSIKKGFLKNVLQGINDFFNTYSYFNTKEDMKRLEQYDSPVDVIKEFFQIVRTKAPNRQIFLFIDEYDHFANELLAFDFSYFKEIVSTNGFVRKFYEAIKTATLIGTVPRAFVTGVMPVTLDSMTSGFNIASNVSTDAWFQSMAGFLEEDVKKMISGAGVPDTDTPKVLNDMKAWYDGYLFHHSAQDHIYNPNMVLFFAQSYQRFKQYPEQMLDINVASDYQKVGRLFRLMNPEQNLETLKGIVENGIVEARLTAQYSFERPWSRDDFVSLLFYLGYLTFVPGHFFIQKFGVPNYVIRELYFQYFLEVQLTRANLDMGNIQTAQIAYSLAFNNDPKPFGNLVSDILKSLSDRDKVGFDEKYVKSIGQAVFHTANVFFIKSEYPVQGGYVDMLLLQKPQNPEHNQMAIELKYLPKKDAKKLKTTEQEAIEQLTRYKSDPQMTAIPRLKLWLLIFVGSEMKVAKEVV